MYFCTFLPISLSSFKFVPSNMFSYLTLPSVSETMNSTLKSISPISVSLSTISPSSTYIFVPGFTFIWLSSFVIYIVSSLIRIIPVTPAFISVPCLSLAIRVSGYTFSPSFT